MTTTQGFVITDRDLARVIGRYVHYLRHVELFAVANRDTRATLGELRDAYAGKTVLTEDEKTARSVSDLLVVLLRICVCFVADGELFDVDNSFNDGDAKRTIIIQQIMDDSSVENVLPREDIGSEQVVNELVHGHIFGVMNNMCQSERLSLAVRSSVATKDGAAKLAAKLDK